MSYNERLRPYQSFPNRDKLNYTVRVYLYNYADQLTESERKIFDYIVSHSVKYPGASWLLRQTIADDTGYSPETVKKAIRKLRLLGIIHIQAQYKSNNLRGANIYVINSDVSGLKPLPDASTQRGNTRRTKTGNTLGRAEREQSVLSKAKTLFKAENKDLKDKNVIALDASYTPGNVPAFFRDTIRPFFNDASFIYKLWGSTRAAVSISGPAAAYIDESVVTYALKQTISAEKDGRIKRDFGAYYYGVLTTIIGHIRQACVYGAETDVIDALAI